ncbi:MAG: cadmium-translocating P-type ATPase [Lachnospiraceae bacterium]|nr:cadmium-translocating P-type ATPase [Lachnospiraceae bacterium]
MTKKQKKELRRIILAGILFFLMIIAEHTAGKLIPEVIGTFPLRRIIFFLLFLIPYGIVGFSVLRKAVLGIGHGQVLDESFLMALATIGAFATGENAEACAVMLFYQIGEFFQDYAVGKSRGSIRELMEIAPEYANLIGEDGNAEEVDPEDVPAGSILLIKPGEKIPIDGVVLTGESLLNTAALTGESVPRNVRPGDAVISGCINGDAALTIRTEKLYEDSTVAKILEMVENASARKSRTENFITRFAKVYTPIVVAGAVLLAFVPPLFVGNFGEWIHRACTFLVISCPCALVISVPLSFFGGIGASSKAGILVKGSNYLEQLSLLDQVVTDKTGTLTEGVFRVTSVEPAEPFTKGELLYFAAAAESASTHPIAAAIREAYGKEIPLSRISDAEMRAGRGILATVDGRHVMAGNEALLMESGIAHKGLNEPEMTVVYVAIDGVYAGSIGISDVVKSEAAGAVREMKDLGVRQVVMLTGDRKSVADAVAKKVGVDRAVAELLPEDKVLCAEKLLEESAGRGAVAFVGDGVNDAPVLMRCDVGIAMGSLGSDAAIEAADVVIMDDRISKIPKAIRIARKTMRIARENIVFALAVKAAILILGALGIAGLWAAVFADVGVAVIAILNAMRCLRS